MYERTNEEIVMEKKRIYMASPTMHGEEQLYIKEAFDTNWLAPLGPHVNAFERELAQYVGIADCAALSLSLIHI